ncbi:unnamed protein product [Macrosiphum euphorbiae]|uniref:Transposable element P transposase-like RNase H domain-containing protein n=1 Tax=Macrosiphum euphorbiae TaxID=13131 RepID=A0AAV0WNC7_9HEMI|nr:unnamed protein product [Macrosiphum euphorbiae]
MINKLNGKVTAAASLFTKLHFRETMEKEKGHRFTLEEKMLSLSIYKRKPKCYRLLSNLITLKCKRTLNNLLSTVSIGPGVSPVVLQGLTENVKKLKPSERCCSLIFDEILLSSGLNFDSSDDKIKVRKVIQTDAENGEPRLVLWFSKHRSGVATNMLVSEWLAKKTEGDKTMVTVAKHKTGDKEPSLIVLGADLAALMERYYRIRCRVRTNMKQFFITNTCGRIIKIYDDINKIYKLQKTKSQLSACVFRRMVESESRGHDSATCSGVAKALQHDPATALRCYQVPDANEAIRRQAHIDFIDHTALFQDKMFEEFDTLFPLEPYSNVNGLGGIREKLTESETYAAFPKAKISEAFLVKIRDWFNGEVSEARDDILFDALREEYTTDSVCRQEVIDAAKSNKVHYFLKYDADKTINRVIKRFR